MNEPLFAHREPFNEIGIAGIMAANSGEPPIGLTRSYSKALQEAIAAEDMASVEALLAAVVPAITDADKPALVMARGR